MESAAPYVSKFRGDVLAVLVTSADSNAATCQIGSRGSEQNRWGKEYICKFEVTKILRHYESRY